MPSKINLEDINKDVKKLAIGLGEDDLQPVFRYFSYTCNYGCRGHYVGKKHCWYRG